MTMRREVAISAGLGVLAVVVVGVLGFLAARAVAVDAARAQAARATEMMARAVVSPAVRDGLLAGDPAALAQLDRAVQAGVLGPNVLTVRLWSPDGTILYSDDLTGIGKRFPLGGEELAVLAGGASHAELSTLDKDENVNQSDFESLLEVYVALDTPDGQRLLFETYQSPDQIAQTTRGILRAFAPIVLGGLALVGLVQALLALRLTRRLEDSQEQRDRLAGEALAASERERRAIAADLHDGVVQDLVGLTYALDALATDPALGPTDRPALAAAAATTRSSVRGLRSLLVEIYPPNLTQVGLAAALADLAKSPTSGATGTELEVTVNLDPTIEEDSRVQAAMYRAAREALSNVRRHARASKAAIVLERVEGRTVLTVTDDGVGFDSASVLSASSDGHVGLRLLADLASSVGATLDLQSTPGTGTVLRMTGPA